MIFNMSTSYFHKISFHYFEDYLMTKLTLGQGNLLFVIMKFSQSLAHETHTQTHTWVT
jgi:hypothetical protein